MLESHLIIILEKLEFFGGIYMKVKFSEPGLLLNSKSKQETSSSFMPLYTLNWEMDDFYNQWLQVLQSRFLKISRVFWGILQCSSIWRSVGGGRYKDQLGKLLFLGIVFCWLAIRVLSICTWMSIMSICGTIIMIIGIIRCCFIDSRIFDHQTFCQ